MIHNVAVMGAGGPSGCHALAALREQGKPATALVHTKDGAERALAAGAGATAVADMTDIAAVTHALVGADAVLMIPPALHPEEDVLGCNAIRAAQQAGVRRFVYLSVLHPYTPTLPHHLRKATVEAQLRHCGVDWTILQPAMYAQMIFVLFGSAPPGTVVVPFDVDQRFASIDLYDLGVVTAAVLLEDGHESASYELAGDSATMAEYVTMAGRARGVKLHPQTGSPSEAKLPPLVVEGSQPAADMRTMFAEYDRHGLPGNATVLRTLLGRPPHTFEAVAARMAGAREHAVS